MARKSKAKQEEEMYKALFGLGGLLAFIITFWLSHSIGTALGVAFAVIILIFFILIIQGLTQRERLKKSGIADIDQMDGRQFEKYLGHLFRAHGYEVNVTRSAGDYGADLVIQKAGKKIVVQAKRHSTNVGIKAVQEVQASIAHYSAAEGWVVSNRQYTDAARELARSNHVRLIDRQELVDMILKMNSGAVPDPRKVIEESPAPEEKVCSRCGSKMILRKGPRGEFYGCSRYPKCRYTEELMGLKN